MSSVIGGKQKEVVQVSVRLWLCCKACQFVDHEAEVSEADECSDDDEDGSDLDEFDGSFIDDDTQLTQTVSTQRQYQHTIFYTLSGLFLKTKGQL